jgi:hypothetical protein
MEVDTYISENSLILREKLKKLKDKCQDNINQYDNLAKQVTTKYQPE